uniref:Myb/SANT-like DNA-binding domain-containing protein n=1 Tax=Echeneis naucrates TaxID=173247 RepID=A0A665VBS0_ECHNA
MERNTGRNWSDQEVRALIQIWSDEHVCRQLESSTRKRDIFVQISNRLMQQGIERDWKQCHTKYKNLKYLYRSLQRGKTDDSDPRRLMRFYEEVDAIMNHTRNGSPHATDPQANSGGLMLDGCKERDRVDIYLTKANTTTPMFGAMEEKTCSSDSVSSISLDVTPSIEELRPHKVKEHRLDHQHRLVGEPSIIIYSSGVKVFLFWYGLSWIIRTVHKEDS